MAKLNHKSTVDGAGTLSLLLSSALYFTLRTASQMLNGTRSWSVRAAVMGSRELVISPWCRPAGLGSAKATEEERSGSDGEEEAGRDVCSVLWPCLPHLPRSPGRGEKELELAASSLCWLEAPPYSTVTKRGGKQETGPLFWWWIDTQSRTKWTFPPFWFCAVIMPVASVESPLILAGMKGGLGLWCVGLKGQQQSEVRPLVPPVCLHESPRGGRSAHGCAWPHPYLPC